MWGIDKDTVYVGACLTVIVNLDRRRAAQLLLSVDDSAPIQLVGRAGPIRSSGERTLVLLSHHLFSRDGFARDEENPGLVHMVPLFQAPGVVRLTLWSGQESLGTKEVRVVPASRAAQEAIRHLFPVLERGARRTRPVLLLPQLLMGAKLSNITDDLDDPIRQLHDELEVISTHPDWTEIATAVVAEAESKRHYDEMVEAYHKARNEGRELNTEPPIPPAIADSLERTSASPFAEAIQKDTRKTLAARRWIPSVVR